jgi:hypothetical protein
LTVINLDKPFYTIKEIATMLCFGRDKVRLLIKDEPGVLKFPEITGGKKSRDARIDYRVPADVLERILRRSANPSL